MPLYGAELREERASVCLDWTGFHRMPFRSEALAPAGKPQPVFHTGSYLTSNSINVAQAVVQELQRLWKERWWNRQGTAARPCLGKSECL